AAQAQRWLQRRGDRFVLDEKIRQRVTVEPLNLALDVYPSFATGTWGMDLILCRNVLIYFDRETVRKVARRLYETLAPGGWLITASSDPPRAADAPLHTVVTHVGVFYRRAPVDCSAIEDEENAGEGGTIEALAAALTGALDVTSAPLPAAPEVPLAPPTSP